MATTALVNGWLRELAGVLNAPDLELDELGNAAFEFDGRIPIGVAAGDDSDVVHFYSKMMQVPEEEEERLDLFDRLLKLNAFGAQTGGASFAVDETEDCVFLWFNVPVAGCDAKAFENTLGNFIEVAERHHELLNTAPMDAGGDGYGDGAGPSGRAQEFFVRI